MRSRSSTWEKIRRPGAPDTAIHCDRLAAYARDAAKEARALSAAHEEMASGKTVQSERPGDEELIALIDHATSSSQHEALAAYYDEVAKDFDREVVKDRREPSGLAGRGGQGP